MSPSEAVGDLEVSFVTHGSSRLAVREWGAGGTSILALHAGVADSRV
ncbi:MAG: hypothetical protein ABIQ53_12695 [Terracoccus sp.]